MAAKQWALIGFTVAMILVVAVPAYAQLSITAGQGSTRSLSSQSATLTVTNGVPGFISATTQRPFVTGLIPVVGDYGGAMAPVYGPAALLPRYRPGPSVIQERLARLRQEGTVLRPGRRGLRANTSASSVVDRKTDNFHARLAVARESSAGHASESIAAIRRRQAQEGQILEREIAELRQKMHKAQAAGKSELARFYQQQIERRNGSPERLKAFTRLPGSQARRGPLSN